MVGYVASSLKLWAHVGGKLTEFRCTVFLYIFYRVSLIQILPVWGDHSNETSLPVLTGPYTCYLLFKISQNEISKIGRSFLLAKFGSERVHRKDMNSQVFMLWPPEKPLWWNGLPFWLGYIVLMTAKEEMSLIRIEKNLTCETVHVWSHKA